MGPTAFRPISRVAACIVAALLLAACYPRFDWRDHRPACGRDWCGFVASFPGRVTTATRDIPVGGVPMPLSLNVVTVGDLTFAVGAFDVVPGGDATLARATLKKKLLDDVGAATAREGVASLRATDRSPIDGKTFEAEGTREGRKLRVVAQFASRGRYLVEVLVLGSQEAMASKDGAQALETFFTSVRLD